MTKKQSTRKGGTTGKAGSSRKSAGSHGGPSPLEKKAREIIADADTYDERTRERIRRALEEEDERLSDLVTTAKILAAGEPADKTSDAWRYWKLRSVWHDLESGDPEREAAARSYVERLAAETFKTSDGHALKQILPSLIIECQQHAPDALAGETTGREQEGADESFQLTPAQAVAIARGWDTTGDERTGDLILLCRALALSDRRHAEVLLDAIEKETALISTTVYDALNQVVESRRAAWQKEVPR